MVAGLLVAGAVAGAVGMWQWQGKRTASAITATRALRPASLQPGQCAVAPA